MWSRQAWGFWKLLCGQAVLTLVSLCQGFCREYGYLLRLEDLCRFAILFIRLYSSCCTGFLASGKLRKLAVYSGAEACSGEASTHSIFPKLWFSSAIFPMTLAKGIARHWIFSYIGEEKSCSHLLHASSLLRVFHPLTTLKSHRWIANPSRGGSAEMAPCSLPLISSAYFHCMVVLR